MRNRLLGAVGACSVVYAHRDSFSKVATCAGLESTPGGEITPELSRFMTAHLAKDLKTRYQTPLFVYSERELRQQAMKALKFPNNDGLTVRFAMKACPNANILRLFHSMGLHFDASSGFEVERAISAGIPANHISLSSQELPANFKELIGRGIKFNACSLKQLETFGLLFPGQECGIRFNPGQGSGGTGKTNVGGLTASFGIWHEQMDLAKEIAAKYNLKVIRIHTHIGSGSDPAVWQSAANMSLALVDYFPNVHTVNLGGGYKVGRMSYEPSTDLQVVGASVKEAFQRYSEKSHRKLHLEIEPGTYLVANAGVLLATVQDLVSTGKHGYKFIKLDAGMTELLRPSLYGAQHPVVVHNDSQRTQEYIVVGHCCESGDLFTCAPGDGDRLQPRRLKEASVGDLVTVEGAGAYCSSMSTKNYNSFPEAAEVLVDESGNHQLIRRRQTLSQIIQNEVAAKF